ncbi:MAG: O-antigen ligase family protein [Ilumatobacteraceae bacterium]
MEVRSGTLALGGLTLGAVLAADSGGWSPFGPAKWLVVSTLALAGIGLTLWRDGPAAERRSWWAWAALVALLSLAALTGGDVPTALAGHPDRHLGVLTWLLLWGLFTAGQRLDADAQRVVVTAGALAAAVLGVWVLVELARGPLIDLATDTRRLTGPFGSAAYLGAAACLLGPVAAGVALDRGRGVAWRVIGGFGAWGTLVALLGAGSRGAWLAAAATVVVAVVVGAVRLRHRPPRRTPDGNRRTFGRRDDQRRPAAAAWRGLLVAAGALVLAIAVVAPRLGDVTERTSGAASRLDEWRVAARVIGGHPLLGVGPEGYRIAAPEGIDAAYEQAHGRDEVLPDRAHSAPLDVALAGGIAAAVVYVVLLAFVAWRALRVLSRRDGRFDARGATRPADSSPSTADAGLAVGVLAYGLQLLVLFPLAELDPIFWLFAGLVVTCSSRPAQLTIGSAAERSSNDDAGTDAIGRVDAIDLGRAEAIAGDAATTSEAADGSTGRSAGRTRRCVATVALVAVPLALVAGVLDVAADRLARHALATSSVDDARRATRLRPDDVRYRLAASTVLARQGSLAGVDAALDQIRAATSWSPHDPLVRDQHATLLLDHATITGTPGDVAAALDAWHALVDDDPHRARWQLQLGRAAALADDVETARRAWEAAALLDPDDPTAPSLLARLPR